MGAPMSDRLSRLTYAQARRLVLVTGLVVLAVVVLVAWARRVEDVEVLATVLFVPIFVGFVLLGAAGGLVLAVGASAIYAAARYPAIDAIGWAEFGGLLTSRSAAYLIFGAVGGWATQVLEGSLTKLELYDEIDDETGLYNARHLLGQLDLEQARARRYQTLFSVAVLDVPAGTFASLRPRARRSLLRELGRALQDGVRTVDHVVHLRDGDRHRLAVVLPETPAEGARVFLGRFDQRVRAYLVARGIDPAPGSSAWSITIPGDEERLAALRADTERIDAAAHR